MQNQHSETTAAKESLPTHILARTHTHKNKAARAERKTIVALPCVFAGHIMNLSHEIKTSTARPCDHTHTFPHERRVVSTATTTMTVVTPIIITIINNITRQQPSVRRSDTIYVLYFFPLIYICSLSIVRNQGEKKNILRKSRCNVVLYI